MKIVKDILAILFMLSTVLFWMGCEKDSTDNPNSGGSTGCTSSFTDARDGEVYCQVTIGNQTWMAENLRYDVLGAASLDTLNPSNPSTSYGRLYDWVTIMNGAASSNGNPSGVQGICPNGWHLPSDDEWNELELELGMAATDTAIVGLRGTHGGEMKSTKGWSGGGNGSSTLGFNAFPAGRSSPTFQSHGVSASFWTSRARSSTAWSRILTSNGNEVLRSYDDITDGFSCRCIKD
jgi:uncharacterized protein (TIGR02145 family)